MKALSGITATVILVAITLIAAVAVAGFVFGLFSSFNVPCKTQVILTDGVHAVIHGTFPNNTNWVANDGSGPVYKGTIIADGLLPNMTHWYKVYLDRCLS